MPHPMNKPVLSVVIVTYNGYKYSAACIRSILASSSVRNLEIIIVDNGSPLGDSAKLRSTFGNKITVVPLDKNYGPSKARNEGVRRAKGEYLAFLDNDTLVEKNWAKHAIAEFERDKKLGIIQCKLLLARERKKIDYVGEYIGGNGFLVQRTKTGDLDNGQFDKKVQILAAKSAGMFIRKKAFTAAGGFDDDYFIYVEETDLGWRSWLAGYKSIFVPNSVVYHEFGTSTVILGKTKNNYNAKFHGSKNYILTLYKNLGTASLFRILPLHVFLWFGLSLYALTRGEMKNFLWINKGIWWNVWHIGRSWVKRRALQQRRVISDEDLFKIVMRQRPFSYFLNKATHKHKVGNAESF